MDTKKFLYLSGGLTGAVAALSGCSSQKAPEQTAPNIIYIMADDLGIGDITPYGQTLIKTPNLERLAAQGMLFTQCYSGTAVSAPSRASLMTGCHTGHTFVRGNLGVDPEGQVAMPAGTFTMATMFKGAGYATGCFGKWGLGFPGSVSDPTEVGFDRFFGYNCQTLAHDYYPDHLWDNKQRVELAENYENKEVTYSADLIHSHAIDFIKENAGKPFFEFLSYTIPHAELILPKDSVYDYYVNLIPAEDDKAFIQNNPSRKGAYGSAERPLAAFAAMVSRLDAYVGEIMDLVDSLGIGDNTLIIFTSDNGPHREGGADPDYFRSYGPYRGIKRDLYEGGIRMPMIMRYPGKVAAGTTNDHIMAFWDMLPTFSELAGYQGEITTDGLSFVPTLLGREGQQEHKYLYWEFHEMGGKQAVRYGDWKGVRLNVGDPEKTVFELYNLSEDIHEDNNVAAQHPEIVAEMEAFMEESHTESELFNFGRGQKPIDNVQAALNGTAAK